MKLKTYVLFAYGLVLLIGGLIGHFKANSLPSLMMGTVSAVLVIACAFGMQQKKPTANTAAMILSGVLTAFFLYRFEVTGKFMPAGLMSVVSLAVLGIMGMIKQSALLQK